MTKNYLLKLFSWIAIKDLFYDNLLIHVILRTAAYPPCYVTNKKLYIKKNVFLRGSICRAIPIQPPNLPPFPPNFYHLHQPKNQNSQSNYRRTTRYFISDKKEQNVTDYEVLSKSSDGNISDNNLLKSKNHPKRIAKNVILMKK